MATEYILQPGYDFGNEFQFGLDVILRAPSPGRFPTATPALWSRVSVQGRWLPEGRAVP